MPIAGLAPARSRAAPPQGRCATRATRHDVAIHAPFAAPLYLSGGEAGGAEYQTWKLASELVEAGLSVCHIVFARDGIEEGPTRGVDLVVQPADEFRQGLARYTRSTLRALERADARVYIQRTAGFETGVVAAFAKLRGRGFIFSSSSSVDLRPSPPLDGRLTTTAFRLGRRLADAVVVQTAEQEEIAAQASVSPTRLIRSFCEARHPAPRRREAFLWIGGLVGYKDPLAYVRLARQLPGARFWMIATGRGAQWESLASEVETAAAQLDNLELLAPRSRDELTELYERTVAVVNTSEFEGFPNTFMEGWSCGALALSLNVDPDGVITSCGIGEFADASEARLLEAARRLWERRDECRDASAAARRYVADEHAPETIAPQWSQLIEEVARR